MTVELLGEVFPNLAVIAEKLVMGADPYTPVAILGRESDRKFDVRELALDAFLQRGDSGNRRVLAMNVDFGIPPCSCCTSEPKSAIGRPEHRARQSFRRTSVEHWLAPPLPVEDCILALQEDTATEHIHIHELFSGLQKKCDHKIETKEIWLSGHRRNDRIIIFARFRHCGIPDDTGSEIAWNLKYENHENYRRASQIDDLSPYLAVIQSQGWRSSAGDPTFSQQQKDFIL